MVVTCFTHHAGGLALSVLEASRGAGFRGCTTQGTEVSCWAWPRCGQGLTRWAPVTWKEEDTYTWKTALMTDDGTGDNAGSLRGPTWAAGSRGALEACSPAVGACRTGLAVRQSGQSLHWGEATRWTQLWVPCSRTWGMEKEKERQRQGETEEERGRKRERRQRERQRQGETEEERGSEREGIERERQRKKERSEKKRKMKDCIKPCSTSVSSLTTVCPRGTDTARPSIRGPGVGGPPCAVETWRTGAHWQGQTWGPHRQPAQSIKQH